MQDAPSTRDLWLLAAGAALVSKALREPLASASERPSSVAPLLDAMHHGSAEGVWAWLQPRGVERKRGQKALDAILEALGKPAEPEPRPHLVVELERDGAVTVLGDRAYGHKLKLAYRPELPPEEADEYVARQLPAAYRAVLARGRHPLVLAAGDCRGCPTKQSLELLKWRQLAHELAGHGLDLRELPALLDDVLTQPAEAGSL